MTSGFEGSIATSPQPTLLTYGSEPRSSSFHVLPPSVVLYRPRSALGTQRSPIAATQAVFGSLGWTTMRAMVLLSASPTCVQAPPPSSDRYTPLPQLELLRSFASPVPTQTTFGSDGATATAPTAATGCSAKMASKVPPLSLVFITPD